MQVVTTVRELQDYADAERAAGRRIALVPTMGALHAGHLTLVDEGRRRADRVVVSIFVNPTQFNDPKDLAAYPRTLEADLAACEKGGVDVVFAPEAPELYPDGAQTIVELTELAKPLCGRTRPGHFRGVATVVTKLLCAAKPHVAVFGEKDWQQLTVVRRMVDDLSFDVDVIGCETVREPDGLALSSRNAYLGKAERAAAPVLQRSLTAGADAIATGERDPARVLDLMTKLIDAEPLASLDYMAVVDAKTLAAVDPLAGELRLLGAARFGKARLIDNVGATAR